MRYVHDGKLCSFAEDGFDSIEQRMWREESIRAIKECIYSYTKFADMADYGGMASCFVQDGKLSWHPHSPPFASGKENIRANVKHIVGKARTQQHFCSNFQMHFRSREKVDGECAMFSWQMWLDESKPTTFCSGRYEFQAVVEDGEWRLSSLLLVLNAKIENGAIADKREGENLDRPWPPIAIGEHDDGVL